MVYLSTVPRHRAGSPVNPALAALAALTAVLLVWLLPSAPALASALAGAYEPTLIEVSVPIEFILFALTLTGVALFHHHTLWVALVGMTTIAVYKIVFTGFHAGPGLLGFGLHMTHEWVLLTNLLGLLVGFTLLARHFEESHVPTLLPRLLPGGVAGAFSLLLLVFILSGFLDNIAAALIGGTVAATVFRHKLHIGYLAGIVAAANAGGAGSVVGDTTTTMMWISGIAPLDVVHAYLAAGAALAVFGIPASIQQHRHSPMVREVPDGVHVDWPRIGIVAAILAAAVGTNVFVNMFFKSAADAFPFLGAAVWVAILATRKWRTPDWSLVPDTLKGSVFLLALVVCASMMPVEKLPHASAMSAFALGFISSVFDNIPLTALALKQGGFDWGVLAFAVGFGGSMIWFGSSAGVALSNLFPEAKSVGAWLYGGWHVIVGYVVGFAVLILVIGWHPHAPHVPAGKGADAHDAVPAAPPVVIGAAGPVVTPAVALAASLSPFAPFAPFAPESSRC